MAGWLGAVSALTSSSSGSGSGTSNTGSGASGGGGMLSGAFSKGADESQSSATAGDFYGGNMSVNKLDTTTMLIIAGVAVLAFLFTQRRRK